MIYFRYKFCNSLENNKEFIFGSLLMNESKFLWILLIILYSLSCSKKDE